MAGIIAQPFETDIVERQAGDFIDAHVPDTARIGRRSLTMSWWALSTAGFFIILAPILAGQFGAGNVLFSMGASVIVFALLGNVLARYAIRTGQSFSQLSSAMFGSGGAIIATLILFATTVYYAVFEGSVVAVAFTAFLASVRPEITALIVVFYSVLLVLGPMQSWLDKVNGVLLPVYALGLAAALFLAGSRYGMTRGIARLDWSIDPAGTWACFSAYMGLWILPMCISDYARFGRREDADYHARINFGMPFYLLTIVVNGLAGIYLVSTIPQNGQPSEISVVQDIIALMGLYGLLFLWATQTRINTANYYLAAINLGGLVRFLSGRTLPHVMAAILVGVIVYALMLSDMFSYLLLALSYQGIFVVAWVAVAFVHAITDDRADEKTADYATPAIKVAGLASWFTGTGAGLALHIAGGSSATYASGASALLAGGVYAFTRVLERRARPLTSV